MTQQHTSSDLDTSALIDLTNEYTECGKPLDGTPRTFLDLVESVVPTEDLESLHRIEDALQEGILNADPGDSERARETLADYGIAIRGIRELREHRLAELNARVFDLPFLRENPDTGINILGLSTRTESVLFQHGFRMIVDLARTSAHDLDDYEEIGVARINEIHARLYAVTGIELCGYVEWKNELDAEAARLAARPGKM